MNNSVGGARKAVNNRSNSAGGTREVVYTMRISAGGARDFDNRNNSISGDNEATTNRSNKAWWGGGGGREAIKTGATVLEGPGRLLTTRATVLENKRNRRGY